MQIKQQLNYRQPSIKTYMQKSNSTASIIYGDRNSHEYADSLMSFKKDFATIDSERRSMELQRKKHSLQKMRQQNLIREYQSKQNQQKDLTKLNQRQKRSQVLYSNGQIKNTLMNSLPINPVSSVYQNNQRGQSLAAKEEQKSLNRIVRAHYLHTIGNSGYNIITGKSSMDFDKIVPTQKHKAFEEKITKLYSQFRLIPQ